MVLVSISPINDPKLTLPRTLGKYSEIRPNTQKQKKYPALQTTPIMF